MVYRADVEFLEDANPQLIDLSSKEFKRLQDLLESVEDNLTGAARVDWVSAGVEVYTRRLAEAKALADALTAAHRAVSQALALYSDAVTLAKQHYRNGTYAEGKLSEVIGRLGAIVLPAGEPLRQWEDLRSTTTIYDWIGELGLDVDEIRDEAERYYGEAAGHYADAQRIESQARVECTGTVDAAYRALPEFRSGVVAPLVSLANLEPLLRAAGRASGNPLTQLPGTGVKVDALLIPSVTTHVSPALLRIQARVDGLPDARGNNYWLPSNSDEGRREFIAANSALINAAAGDAGLPPAMIAGIAWQEVEGDPAVQDDIVIELRERGIGGDPDHTSLGPLSIQVRRAAEVLGYDPNALTDYQRDIVVNAVRDPAQNIFIATEHIAQLKAQSDFADVPPEQMTRAQMQELAARYNGTGPDAEAYGRAFERHLDEAQAALG